jgi:hypothetical protein
MMERTNSSIEFICTEKGFSKQRRLRVTESKLSETLSNKLRWLSPRLQPPTAIKNFQIDVDKSSVLN